MRGSRSKTRMQEFYPNALRRRLDKFSTLVGITEDTLMGFLCSHCRWKSCCSFHISPDKVIWQKLRVSLLHVPELGKQRPLSAYSSLEKWDKVAMTKACEKVEMRVGWDGCPWRCIPVVWWVCGGKGMEPEAGQRKCSQDCHLKWVLKGQKERKEWLGKFRQRKGEKICVRHGGLRNWVLQGNFISEEIDQVELGSWGH